MKDIRPEVDINKIIISPELDEVQKFMPIDPKDKANLKSDIELNGLKDPIKVYSLDRKFYVLAGLTRLEIMKELQYKTIPVEVVNLSEEKRKQFAVDDNLNRRHLTNDQKDKLMTLFIQINPEITNTEISEKLNMDRKTVKKKRDEKFQSGEIPHTETRTRKDGKNYSVKKPEKKIDKPQKTPAAANTGKRPEEIKIDFTEELTRELYNTITRRTDKLKPKEKIKSVKELINLLENYIR
jgi:predicted transcriptional regulator